jgi:hypothetical protein
MIRIEEIFWLRSIREKIQTKHSVTEEEVEWVLMHRPHVRFSQKGNVAGETCTQRWEQLAGDGT